MTMIGFMRALCLVAAAGSSAAATLQPFAGSASTPLAPWEVAGLPQQTKPFTRFSVVDLDGHRALRVEADLSYGNLVHPLNMNPGSGHLAWQWRLDEPNMKADLRVREGEDIALKVCTMWDMPIEKVPFADRQVLRIVRGRTHEPVPAATVCYVWDPYLPVGTTLDSPFTRRLRFIVLRSGVERLHQWTSERRDIAADFLKLFGSESTEIPPLVGVALGADADNTRGHSVGHVADVVLDP